LVVRICFILGNLSCDKTSNIPDIIFDYIPDLVQLLELLVRKTINNEEKLKEERSSKEIQESEDGHPSNNTANENNHAKKEEIYLKEKEEEDVLIKV